ncbi:MAG: hypothetical protein PUJ94_05835 [Ruminococcus sp.]|nr:hypothetical protein [Ruminococcus sp.]
MKKTGSGKISGSALHFPTKVLYFIPDELEGCGVHAENTGIYAEGHTGI